MSPKRRAGHSAVVDEALGLMWVFGGCTDIHHATVRQYHNDLHCLDLNTMSWLPVRTGYHGDIRPSARYRAASVFIPSSKELIIWGGSTHEDSKVNPSHHTTPPHTTPHHTTPHHHTTSHYTTHYTHHTIPHNHHNAAHHTTLSPHYTSITL